MKADIHPQLRPVVFVDGVQNAAFKILSCVNTKETIALDGEQYPMVRCDVTSASHPFFTGQHRILDTTGRVERFDNKYGKSLTAILKKKS